jgi:hypothetical protein
MLLSNQQTDRKSDDHNPSSELNSIRPLGLGIQDLRPSAPALPERAHAERGSAVHTELEPNLEPVGARADSRGKNALRNRGHNRCVARYRLHCSRPTPLLQQLETDLRHNWNDRRHSDRGAP